MKSREKLALIAFLVAILSFAHAFNSPSARIEVERSSSHYDSCPRCGCGYVPFFCHANKFGLRPTTVITK
jgi:hypothetical protein